MNSLRALPYVLEWHRRYAGAGLRTIGVHTPQFEFGTTTRETCSGRWSASRSRFPVASDPDYEIWRLYGNEVWPALYLWDRRGVLRHYHFGEGLYADSEEAIHEVLREIDEQVEVPETMAPLRPTDAPAHWSSRPLPTPT